MNFLHSLCSKKYLLFSTQMVLTRSPEVKDVEPLSRGQDLSHGQTQGRGWIHGSVPSRSSARGLSPEPRVEHVGGVSPTSVLSSSFAPVLEGLLVYLLTHLEVSPLVILGVPPVPSLDPPVAPTFV